MSESLYKPTYPLNDRQAQRIANAVNRAHRCGKTIVEPEDVKRVASGDYLESHPIDCTILAELRRLK